MTEGSLNLAKRTVKLSAQPSEKMTASCKSLKGPNTVGPTDLQSRGRASHRAVVRVVSATAHQLHASGVRVTSMTDDVTRWHHARVLGARRQKSSAALHLGVGRRGLKVKCNAVGLTYA